MVLWQPALFGAKPEIVVKGGQIAWSQMGKWGWNCCEEVFFNENSITTDLLIRMLCIKRWFTNLTGHLWHLSQLSVNLNYYYTSSFEVIFRISTLITILPHHHNNSWWYCLYHQEWFWRGCLLYVRGQSHPINKCQSWLWLQTIWIVLW